MSEDVQKKKKMLSMGEVERGYSHNTPGWKLRRESILVITLYVDYIYTFNVVQKYSVKNFLKNYPINDKREENSLHRKNSIVGTTNLLGNSSLLTPSICSAFCVASFWVLVCLPQDCGCIRHRFHFYFGL